MEAIYKPYKDAKGNDKYIITINNETVFDPISSNVKTKLGDLNDFINYIKNSGADIDSITQYMNVRGAINGFDISAYEYYSSIATAIYNKISNTPILHFENLNISNTELTEDKNGRSEVFVYYCKPFTTTPPYFDSLSEEEKTANSEVYALKYKPDEYNYPRDEKKQRRYQEEKYCYDNFLDNVTGHLSTVFSNGHKVMVLTIPSSKTHNKNLPINEVVKSLSKINQDIIDGSICLYRTEDKVTSHSESGAVDKTRNIQNNVDTLAIKDEAFDKFKDAEFIVVLDDVTTSGHSFIAADEVINKFLEHHDLKRPIINISYAKTCHDFYLDGTYSDIKDNKESSLKGIIFDIDNTILPRVVGWDNDQTKEWNFRNIKDHISSNLNPKILQTIERCIDSDIKIAYVSNRSQRLINTIINDLIGTIKNGIPEHKLLDANDFESYEGRNPGYSFFNQSPLVISATAIDHSGYGSAKPSPKNIDLAIRNMGLDKSKDKVIGVGNQESDILAYGNAGIKPILVNWFNSKNDKKYNPIPFIDYMPNELPFDANIVDKYDDIDGFDAALRLMMEDNGKSHYDSFTDYSKYDDLF